MFQIVSGNLKEVWEWFQMVTPLLKPNHDYVYTVKQYKAKRSLSQNKLYWLLITAIADETGDDRDSIHEAYKRNFLPWKEVEVKGGLSYWDVSSTPDQDTKEFTEYIDKIYRHSQEFLGLTLPRPDDKAYNSFVEKYEKY
ncbi:MAG TPA: hypothetical protein VMV77_09360, partial [Bacteroidales bacterium]|nr:hypothetical protein [Bacteroidales bacterium]